MSIATCMGCGWQRRERRRTEDGGVKTAEKTNRQMEPDHSGKGYERLAARAMRALFRMEDRGGIMVRNVVMKGASGAGHEADLILEVPLHERLVYILAECKDYARPVGKEKVAAFRTVLEDINALREKGQRFPGRRFGAGPVQPDLPAGDPETG